MTEVRRKMINSIHKPPALFNFRSIRCDHPVTVEPFQFSPSEKVAYEGSQAINFQPKGGKS